MEVVSIVVVLVLVCSGHYGAAAHETYCKADVVFILDESNSITPDDFLKQLEFVNKVIDHLTINKKDVQIGVMSFGRGVNTDILGLGEFASDPEAMKNMILALGDERPNNNDCTRTDLALQHARTDMFRYARPGIRHIAIIITDGEPILPTGTAADGRRITKQKADQLKATGVELFAIGVGQDSKRDQLLEMATYNSYVFVVDNYDVLDVDLIYIEVCPWILPQVPNIEGCWPYIRPVDVIFAAANGAGVADMVYTIDFFKGLTRQLIVAPDQVKDSLTPRNCLDLDGITFDDYIQKLPLERALHNRHVQETNLSSQLNDIVQGFSTQLGARPINDSKNELIRMVLMVVDNQIVDPLHVVNKTRELLADRIRLYVIGVGPPVYEELERISNYFHVISYSHLYTLLLRILDTFCIDIGDEYEYE